MLEAEPETGHGAGSLGEKKQRNPGINIVIYSPERPSASTHHVPGVMSGWVAEGNGGPT